MAPITRTCSLALGLAHAAAQPASANVPKADGPTTFVAARAAADAGDASRAAVLYAMLAEADPANRVIAARALGQAILAGNMPLALRLARAQEGKSLAVDARLLLAADGLRAGQGEAALGTAWPTELGFIAPFVRAWALAERGKWRPAVALLDTVKADQPLAQFAGEHKALILLAAGKDDLARPLIDPAIAQARGRGDRLRIAFAAGLTRAGNRAAATALLQGRDTTLVGAARQLAAERKPALPIATAAQGFSELLTALAVTLGEENRSSLPLGLAQVARHADPANEQARVLLGLLLDQAGRSDDAVAVLRGVGEASPFLGDARDAEVRVLLRADREQEALARASAFVAGEETTADDWSRLGDVADAANRHADAAEAFTRALALVEAGGPGPDAWSLHLLRGAALEEGGRWPEAEQALERAHALAPDNPVVLNYLGYARLERGQKMDEAEKLIAEASRRAPDDASITDSLGWAQFKRGRVDEAIGTLQRAAAADPAQAEINEHLGDALYTAGRKYEARFAWNAALVTAEDELRQRVEAKINGGLTPATAAP